MHPAWMEQRWLAGLYQDQPKEWDDPLPVLPLVAYPPTSLSMPSSRLAPKRRASR